MNQCELQRPLLEILVHLNIWIWIRFEGAGKFYTLFKLWQFVVVVIVFDISKFRKVPIKINIKF